MESTVIVDELGEDFEAGALLADIPEEGIPEEIPGIIPGIIPGCIPVLLDSNDY